MGLYHIQKGDHYSNGGIGITVSNTLTFSAMLDESCLYSTEGWDEKDKLDINKLIGFTNGLSQADSARFGWRCIDNQYFQIVTYVHDGGAFVPGSEKILGIVFPKETFGGKLRNIGKTYIFNFNNGPGVVVSKKASPGWIKFLLKFYFGGTNVAQHDMFAIINN
jgi:hypothetical protein